MNEKNVSRIPIEKIVIPEIRARSRLTPEQMEFLQRSLKTFGVMQYPIVRPLPNGKYELIDGEHRLKVARESGIDEIECLVIPASEKEAAIINILMNVARGQQDPMGIARAIKKALESGMSYKEIAAIFNRSENWVKFYESLLDLPEHYQKALEEGRLTVTHIREALRLGDLYEIDQALQTALNLSWNAATLKHYVDNRLEQLREHQRMVQETGIVTPPPPPEPEKLVKYSQCLICGRMVPREQIYLPPICSDCYNLSKYLVENIGTGKDAMQYIYNALTNYQAFLRYQQEYAMQEQMKKIGFKPPIPPGTSNPKQKQQEQSQ